MGLLTVYQIGESSPPANFGIATAVPAKQQSTAQRAVTEYTAGQGFFKTPATTAATEPLLGGVSTGSTPQYPYIIAVDQTETTSIAVGAMAAGTAQTITTNLSFTLPTITLDPTDQATLSLVPNVYQNPINTALVIASVQMTPQAYSPTAGWIIARTLQAGQTYTAWRCQVTIGLVAVTASSATSISVGAHATLTALPQ